MRREHDGVAAEALRERSRVGRGVLGLAVYLALLAAAFRKDPRSRPAAPDLLDYLLPNRAGAGRAALAGRGSVSARPAPEAASETARRIATSTPR